MSAPHRATVLPAPTAARSIRPYPATRYPAAAGARSEAMLRPVAPSGQRAPGAHPAPRAVVRFLTVAEVAGSMRVSKMTVYRLVHGGDLAAVRVGRSFRVPESAVRDYLRGATTVPA